MTSRNTKRTLAALLATLTTIALAGCGTATGTQTGTQTEQVACTRIDTVISGPIVAQCDITLNDTRHVTCLIANWKGLTCDWAHASGTDKEPGR